MDATLNDLINLKPGDMVKFTEPFDIYPYCIIDGGTVATVVVGGDGENSIWVLPHGHRIEELKEWDGQVHIMFDTVEYAIENGHDTTGFEIIPSTATLCDEYKAWCATNNLTPMSADELAVEDFVNEEQRNWLLRFIERWDVSQEAEDGRGFGSMFPDTKMSDEDAMHIELVASEAIRLNDLHGDQGSEDAIEASNNFFEEFRKAGFDTSKYETEKSSQNDMIIDALKRMREWRA